MIRHSGPGVSARSQNWPPDFTEVSVSLSFSINRVDYLLKQHLVHLDVMGSLRKTAFLDVGDVFTKGGDTFLLQAPVFIQQIAASLGVTREAIIVIAENII